MHFHRRAWDGGISFGITTAMGTPMARATVTIAGATTGPQNGQRGIRDDFLVLAARAVALGPSFGPKRTKGCG